MTFVAYAVIVQLPVMVPVNPVLIFVSACCSTIAVVTMFRFIRSGPAWSRVLIGIVILPLLL